MMKRIFTWVLIAAFCCLPARASNFLINPYVFQSGSSFLPTDIAGIQFWSRADMGVTGSAPVTAWDDISGNARHLSSSNGPAFSATGGPNSTPMLDADGSDWMDSTSFSLAFPIHVFMIVRIDSNDNNDRVMAFGTVSDAATMTGTTLQQNFGSAAGNSISPSTGTWYLVESFANGASSFMRLNGGAKSDGTNPGTNAISSGFTIFNRPQHNRPADCAIAEIVMYNAEITGADLAQLMAYFSNRYGLF